MANKIHNYYYPVDTESNTAAAKVIEFVGNKKRVLEIGCGPGSITKILHGKNECSIVGLELDPEAIRLVSPYCEKVIDVDLNNLDWQLIKSKIGQFDTIVAADVLEHLYDPWSVLANLEPLLKSNGEIVVSLPHVGHAAIAACLINSNFEYRDWGLLDRTHIRFFGLTNIDSLFQKSHLKIIAVSFVITSPEETELAPIWASLNSKLKTALQTSNHSNIYQVVVKAVPVSASGEALFVSSAIKTQSASAKGHVRLSTKIKMLLPTRIIQIIKKFMGA
jgi:SAM-dependent methyltransferase